MAELRIHEIRVERVPAGSTTPPGRTFTIPAEPRTLVVPYEDRTVRIS